jgi:hypothetical protein
MYQLALAGGGRPVLFMVHFQSHRRWRVAIVERLAIKKKGSDKKGAFLPFGFVCSAGLQ